MKLFKAFIGMLVSMVMALAFGYVVHVIAQKSYHINLSMFVPAAIYFFLTPLLSTDRRFRVPGAYAMAIQQELWCNYIMDNLFKGNEFLSTLEDEGEYVLAGSVVHIPKAGANPAVTKNRSVFPAVAVRRVDTDLTYPLDWYSTEPTHIPNAEKYEISYDKLGSVLSSHVLSLGEQVADDALIKCAPSAALQIIRTTGADSAEALSPSATGTRKAFTKDELRRAQTLMNKLKIPKTDRYALLPPDMLAQLMSDSTLLGRDGMFGGEVDLKQGIVGRLYGFAIMERADVLVYNNAGTPVVKAFGAAAAATDNMAAICYQSQAMTRALGSIHMYSRVDDPLYYGDIYSAEVKFGGRIKRAEGVVAIVQAV